MARIVGFVHQTTGSIITNLDVCQARRVHRSVASLAAQDARYGWVWRADSGGVLCPFECINGRVRWTCIRPTDKARASVKAWQLTQARE